MNSHLFVNLGQLQLKICLSFANFLHLQVKLFVLSSEIINVILHLLVLELCSRLVFVFATGFSELLELRYKLYAVLAKVCDQGL